MTKKPRGRPRSYDPEEALTRAMESFWESGFAGTSLDDLSAATGMNRPSLYAAFGDKKAIYLKALETFADSLRAALRNIEKAEMPLPGALKTFYDGAIDIYLSGEHGARGCYIACTAPAEAARDDDIRTALRTVLRETDDGLEKLFAKAREKGELARNANASERAQIAASVLHSIALRARSGATRKELQTLARYAISMLS